jgi:hypothetical protein
MKYYLLVPIIIITLAVLSCESNDPKTISASATAYRNESGELVVRDATKAEIESIDRFYDKIQKIEKKYPAPQIPKNQETFAVSSINEDGVFLLENNLQLKMSGIKCSPEGLYFIRKFLDEDTERIAYAIEKESSNGIIEGYIWVVDSSMMNNADMKEYKIGPSFSGLNDTVILNNWCEIEYESASKYRSRYVALEKISCKNKR